MYKLRLAIVALVGGVATFGASQPAQAQVYAGFGYRVGSGFGYGGHYSGYYANNYGAYPYNNWYVGPQGYGTAYGSGYTSNYGIGALGYGPGYGIAGPVVASPYYGTTTTIIRGGPTGGVIQYTHNGNGYTYVPDSTYPTVIEQQPTLGLSRTVVVPSAPPVVVESRPQGSTYGLPSNAIVRGQSPSTSGRSRGTIKLICPKASGGPLSYSLNGHVFTIQPGYAQTFSEDREWTLEFKRGGDESEVASYSLKAGTYIFAVGENGWELQPAAAKAASELPPAPLPEPAPTAPTSLPPLSLPPSPLPPP